MFKRPPPVNLSRCRLERARLELRPVSNGRGRGRALTRGCDCDNEDAKLLLARWTAEADEVEEITRGVETFTTHHTPVKRSVTRC